MALPPKTGACKNAVAHSPGYGRTVWHHILPQMWGGSDDPTNLAELCDNCHYFGHVVLDRAIKLNRWLTRTELVGVPLYVRLIAKTGFLARPVGPVQFTSHFSSA